MPPGKRGVGFVFQNYAIFTHMTVAENIGFGLKIAGRHKDEIAKRGPANRPSSYSSHTC